MLYMHIKIDVFVHRSTEKVKQSVKASRGHFFAQLSNQRVWLYLKLLRNIYHLPQTWVNEKIESQYQNVVKNITLQGAEDAIAQGKLSPRLRKPDSFVQRQNFLLERN
jgi:hypothetical protein